MKVVTVQNEHAKWDLFVQALKGATSYHRFGWKAIFARSFGHTCHYLVAINDSGEWQGILPLVHMRSRTFGNFLVSLPFVNYGGLLCKNKSATVLLLDEAEKIRRSCGATYVELRHVACGLEGLPAKQHKVTMILDLAGDVESQWRVFNPKLRNQIRKAEKSGLQFAIGHLDLLDDFYEVFARNMRDLGTPVYAKCFFRHVLEIFADTTRIFAVVYEGKVIAAGIALWFKDTLEIPWASSIGDYKALCPNNMLYWKAIQFAIEHGFSKFDFGRSTPHEGTFNFKKQWGAQPVQLFWLYLMDKNRKIPELNPANKKYQKAIRIWQHLPIPLTKMLGPLIVRNIP